MPQSTDHPTWRYANAEAELPDYHLGMLLDDARMRAYQQAIASSVRPADLIVLINEWSTAVDLSEPADVVITETIGNAAFDEGIIAWTAAVESWDDHAQVSDWSAPTQPVDYSVDQRRRLNRLEGRTTG